MPGGSEQPVLGSAEYQFPLLPPVSGGSTSLTLDFIGSVTAVYTPIVQDANVEPPFITSVTAVYTPTVVAPGVTAPFISSATALYAPTVAYTGDVVVPTGGTYYWICPPGVTSIQVQGYGGGGGGGGSSVKTGGGGGGGAFAGRVAVPVTPGTVYTFVVGAAGTAETNGSSSTFTGDSGVQVIAAGGGAGGNGVSSGPGGTGGQASASTGDTGLKFSGGDGGTGNAFSGLGGGGGASGNEFATGANGTSSAGGGAGGVGANGGGSGGTGNTAGHAPGGGGGGNGGTDQPGLAGADGEIVISLGVVTVPFIGSVTVVYAPTLSSTDVRPAFIDSQTRVYQPTLRVAFTGAGVSQVALEVLTSDSTADAYVSQVTLEIIVPWYKGLHVWEKTGQTGG